MRKVPRSVHEAARDKARAINKTEAYVVSCRERKKVEMLFAHLKRILRLDRLRLRGPNGARDEFLLAATAHKVATPVNWKNGEDVIIAGSVTDDDAKKQYPQGWKA